MCVGMSAALVYPKSGFVYAGAVCQSSDPSSETLLTESQELTAVRLSSSKQPQQHEHKRSCCAAALLRYFEHTFSCMQAMPWP